jgi:hypothetical protein
MLHANRMQGRCSGGWRDTAEACTCTAVGGGHAARFGDGDCPVSAGVSASGRHGWCPQQQLGVEQHISTLVCKCSGLILNQLAICSSQVCSPSLPPVNRSCTLTLLPGAPLPPPLPRLYPWACPTQGPHQDRGPGTTLQGHLLRALPAACVAHRQQRAARGHSAGGRPEQHRGARGEWVLSRGGWIRCKCTDGPGALCMVLPLHVAVGTTSTYVPVAASC